MAVSGALPMGTVTLLLADIEGSTRLWETDPEAMTAAIARLDDVVSATVAACGGVRPVEQGEGDSFVVAFGRASDAVRCALALQRAALSPIRLRIGVHTGEVQLRDEGNYVGSTPNRAARLRDLAHGGQTVLSGTTCDLVVDRLADGVSLRELGTHRLRGFERPERVVQLCHPDVPDEFPPLRSDDAAHNLPRPLTSFVGRQSEITEVGRALMEQRLVTLTGAGGVGKTRLALAVADAVAGEFADGVWLVELAAITDPDAVAGAVLRALGVAERFEEVPAETLARFVARRHMLVVVDNCEHLLDATATLALDLLHHSSTLRVLATSREPIGVAGEVTWRVPSLSLHDEAVELFVDRARRVRPDFQLTPGNRAAVVEICRRLDGVPLAIELAAARVRVLSPLELVASLQDRFRVLVGGTRTAVRRQQTLRASVDWSHALLTEPERVLFRRLAPFTGGFDLRAAEVVGDGEGLDSHQVLDQLSSLVDKSLVNVDETGGQSRYRLLETVRQYALEKLGESGESATVRTRHRNHYVVVAARLDAPGGVSYAELLKHVEVDIDNLRAAFDWSLDAGEIDTALRLTSSLQPLWVGRGLSREGLRWLDTALAERNPEQSVAAAAESRALADKVALGSWIGVPYRSVADEALTIARQLDDPAVLAHALNACAVEDFWAGNPSTSHLVEAIELARATDQKWLECQLLGWQTYTATAIGNRNMKASAQAAIELSEQIGDPLIARVCRSWLAWSRFGQRQLHQSVTEFRTLAAQCDEAGDQYWRIHALHGLSLALAYHGDGDGAIAAGRLALRIAIDNDFGHHQEATCHVIVGRAAIAAGDVATLHDASAGLAEHIAFVPLAGNGFEFVLAESALASGDLDAAQTWADRAVTATTHLPFYAGEPLITRMRVATARGEREHAIDDAFHTLALARTAVIYMPDVFDGLAYLATNDGREQDAVRLYGVADSIRQQLGAVRSALYRDDHERKISALRARLGDDEFDQLWTQGAALAVDEAVAYAQRGHGERRRPSSGWASLTPTEHDVVRLIAEGLANKQIAARLFMSPRTVQSHLTHVYSKLGLTSRVQLAQEAQRHH